MPFLSWCGLVAVAVFGCFFPRFVASILGGMFFGGGAWWNLFVPLCLIGLIIDISVLAKD